MGAFETLAVNGAGARLYTAGLQPGKPGVIVFHPWWGLNDDVTTYADRLAAEGFAVAAPDSYKGAVTAEIKEAARLSSTIDETHADAVALATADLMADRLGPSSKIATLGFSMGAAWALWTPAQRDRLSATVIYYGSMLGPSLAASTAPVLGHFAESDPYEAEQGLAAFEEALRSAGRSATINRYAGTGHWFAEPSRDAYRREAAESAFRRTVDFLRA